ncbi:uncharacterized protein xmas [Epargyreus clarus]|uniref:uncharacterized protein xmas n=1 Tax=Epargyreus clarus TaxID=520877 RepID=UPI003C2BB9D9
MDTDHSTSPPKKLKSPQPDGTVNPKTSVICSKVPESLFETGAAEKHFNKFGKVQRIKLYRKRHMCLVEFDQVKAAELAVLNAGAYDGFMFDVTRRCRVRRKSKKEDDPDWTPDPEVEEELSAMSGAPSYRFTRQKSMDLDPIVKKRKPPVRVAKFSPVKKRVDMPLRSNAVFAQPISTIISAPVEVSPVITVSNTYISTSEAAAELHQLSFKVSLTPDEQWRILDARDKILRSWGGAGSRVKVGGATIGTCPDMCPEKELLQRQFEHQVMTLETRVDSDGDLEPWRAVKQYSRSSADQEIPMCYELRPASVLMRTCAYLLHEIADTKRQVTLADWFHFMWDRFRSIRKDITQQALCCRESIQLVEICARFHAHCAARLADLEHTQFDQKLNTDNLTKCLQTLKHMYDDDEVTPEQKPNEAEFRGYIALLNLGDSNFLWEIKHLPHEIQKSEPIVFAIQVFIALDNNNYVKFFRLIKQRATYLQACILLRYFNDVRARALARIVKGFAPRGSSRYPAEELMKTLSFESIESMKSFINHYGLRLSRVTDTDEYDVILNRNQFIEDSDPYPIARAISLIESKRQSTVGQVIAGGILPDYDFANYGLHSSFNNDGKLKVSALIAEDLGYNTINDSNKDVQSLKAELFKLLSGSKTFVNIDKTQEIKRNIFTKPEEPPKYSFANEGVKHKGFSFQPAIPIAPKEIVKTSPEKIFAADTKNIFKFSKPEESPEKDHDNVFKSISKSAPEKSIFGTATNAHVDPFKSNNNLFKVPKPNNDVFKKPTFGNSIFGQKTDNNLDSTHKADSKNIFSSGHTNLFTKKEEVPESHNIFKPTVQADKNIFGKSTTLQGNDIKSTSNIFGSIGKASFSEKPSLFNSGNVMQPGVVSNGDSVFAKTSPGSLFKNALQPNDPETKNYLIFQSKNKPTVANSIFNSVNNRNMNDVYNFDQNADETNDMVKMREMYDQKVKEDEQREMAEQLRREEERRQEEERQKEEMRRREEEKRREVERRREEARRKEEQRLREEERRREEERLKKIEERKQQELKERLERERQAELQRKAEEEERKFKARVEKESGELINELIDTVEGETVREVLKEEMDSFKELMLYANETTENIFTEVCSEICHAEIKAEMFLSKRLMIKWFSIWKKQVARNVKRRKLLEDTPVWLTNNTPYEEAKNLRRIVEKAALRNMNAIHRGYRFNGELRQLPSPDPYNVMEIIRSPLLKRARQINYPYDKCFFWKVTLISPGADKWLCRKVNLEKWLKDAFGDKKSHEISSCLINVGRHSWNNLMNFAISVSLINKEQKHVYSEALEGANSLLFYITEHNITDVIDEIMKQKYQYQVIPVAIITSLAANDLSGLEMQLMKIKNNNLISDYKIYYIDVNNVITSLDNNTKRALKWLAKNYQKSSPIEIDHLKSICERYLGNEIWCKLKFENDSRMSIIHKDLNKLIEIYNISLEKLTKVLTDENLFNYPSFPLEFKEYLDNSSPYPKPYEFIPSNVKNTENIDTIKDIMNRLKLPRSTLDFQPQNNVGMQENVRTYCKQIGWFENPEQVVCKVVAILPDAYSVMPCQDLSNLYEHNDLIDLLNIIVYEKISKLRNFENRYAIYDKSALEDYRNSPWIYETNVLNSLKHKAVDYEDELDLYLDAKRRKMAFESQECLMLDDNDQTLLQENIQVADESISNYNNYKEAVQQLEKQLEEERKKSDELDNLLKAALCDAV